jgi:predicted O-linked N-acetylglucosamine transferase (SPINDLY family)
LRDRYRELFASRGVLPHRLEFCGVSQSLEEHLRTMASVDLALDPFPYQGTMTSLECLSVGTPMITRGGAYYAHRATSAMLLRMGMHELVAGDSEEYIEIGVQLLQDLSMLRELRTSVKAKFNTSPLCDPIGFMRDFEQKLDLLVTAPRPSAE